MSRTSRNQSNQNRQHDEPPTTTLFMPSVIDNTKCGFHDANEGQPCFRHWALTDGLPMIDSICNHRAIKAGFNGTIDPTSLTRRPFARPGE
jgi:hypothetical protein